MHEFLVLSQLLSQQEYLISMPVSARPQAEAMREELLRFLHSEGGSMVELIDLRNSRTRLYQNIENILRALSRVTTLLRLNQIVLKSLDLLLKKADKDGVFFEAFFMENGHGRR